MKKLAFYFAFFATVGITNEIFFTAITDLIDMIQAGEVHWDLKGVSYIWMFPIYGASAFLFVPFWQYLSKLHIVFRALIYGAIILTVEFITGGLLDLITGHCPWEYTEGWHLMGYIRFDFYPLWCLFGLLIERVYVGMESVTKLG